MRFIFLPCLLIISLNAHSQNLLSISEQEVSRIENILAADDMQGRQVFTPGIDKAADFIKKEFREAGLKPLPGSKDGFNQSFTMLNPEATEISAIIDGTSIDNKNILVFSNANSLTVTAADHYQKVYVKKGSDFRSVVFK